MNDKVAKNKDLILVRLDKCQALLDQCRSVNDAVKVAAMADAARIFAKRVDAGIDTVNKCTAFQVKAERRMGEHLLKMPKNTGAKGIGKSVVQKLHHTPTIADLGLVGSPDRIKKVSARCRKLAKQPEAKSQLGGDSDLQAET